jgi:hypothetical protein
MELPQWREIIQHRLFQEHQNLSDNWKICAIGERIRQEGKDLTKIKDLSPEAIRLGYEFSVTMQNKDNRAAIEILTQIENLDSIWREEL